jgi:histidinol dehydrogenase
MNMEIIRGFAAARAKLARSVVFDFGKTAPRSAEIFGRALTPQEAVERILQDVRNKGDAAVADYTQKIDGYQLTAFEVDRRRIAEAYREVSPQLVEALQFAAERIRRFHQKQKQAVWRGINGKEWGQLIRPLASVGLYAPGGTAAYPSTVLMIAIPPKVAGVKEIILCTPPRNDGQIPPFTLAAADIAGVDRVFAIGGAQAIGALAYGTESVPKVDKICGPGNLFIMLAKKAVFGVVDIDALQGPSEVMVIADRSANPVYCAADLLAQAEHDVQAQVVLVTTSARLAAEIEREIETQMALLPRVGIAAASIAKKGIIAIVQNMTQAVSLANLFAPEHLELAVRDAESYLDKIENAGCVFTGPYSTEPIGDYVAGPNHSLPTGGTARFSSPLNILDFMKIIDVVKVNRTTVKKLGPAAITIARAEGLEAHARAIEKRLPAKRIPSSK